MSTKRALVSSMRATEAHMVVCKTQSLSTLTGKSNVGREDYRAEMHTSTSRNSCKQKL